MKLLPTEFSVDWTIPALFEGYAAFYPSWAWIGKTVNGQAKQLFKYTTCREIFTAHLKKDIVENRNNICTDHTRFALKSMYSKESFIFKHNDVFKISDNAMKTAINMLNIMEKEAGWGLTTITKLERRTFKNANNDKIIINTYIITGPKEWMRATPLISLYTLLIRSGWFKRFSKVKQVGNIIPICEKIINSDSSVDKIRQHINNMKESYKYWLLLILNKNKLFGKRTPISIYSKNNEHSGITSLVNLSVGIDVTTRNRWKELVKEHKK